MLDVNKLRLTHSPLINKLHLFEWTVDPRLQTLLNVDKGNNFTNTFIEDMEWRANNGHNIVIDIKGIRGSGKSYLARGIKGLTDKIRGVKSHIEDIVFTRAEYMDCYSTARAGQTFVIDEDFGFQTQTGSLRIRESMMLAEQTFRIEEVSTIACSVAPSYSHLYDFYLLAYDYDVEHGINRAIVFNTSQLGGMMARPIGYILFPTKKYLNPSIEKAYQEKKKVFTTKVKKGLVRTLQEDYDRYASDCVKKFGWDKSRPTERMVKVYLRREYPQMANTERDDILDTLIVKLYEIHGSKKGKKEERGE